MKNTKHTKGEWRQHATHEHNELMKKDDYYRTITAGDGFLDKDNNGFCLTGFISEADAKLIAAAPNLLEALQSVLNLIDTGDLVRDISKDEDFKYFTEQGIRITKSLASAQNALKKAKATT